MGIDVEAPLARTPVRHSVGVSEPREGKLAKLTGPDEASRRVSTGIVDNSGSAAARRAPAQPREGEASRRESTLELAAFLRGTGPTGEPSGRTVADYEDGLPPVAPAGAVRKRSGFFKLPIQAIQTSIGIGGFSAGNARASSAQSPPFSSKFEDGLPGEHLTKRVLPNGRSYLTTGSLSGSPTTGSLKTSPGILRHKASGSSSITPSVSSLSATCPVTKPGRPRSATYNGAPPVADLLQLLREGPDAARRSNGAAKRRMGSGESEEVPLPQRQAYAPPHQAQPDLSPREAHLEREEVMALPVAIAARTFAPSDFGRAGGLTARRRERTSSGATGVSDEPSASLPKRDGLVYGADAPNGLPHTPPLSRDQLCGSEASSAKARAPAQPARPVDSSLLLASGHVPAGFGLVPAPPRSPSNHSPRPVASTHSAPLAPGEGEAGVPRAATRRFGSSPWAPPTSDRTFGSGMSDTAPTSESRSSMTSKRASLMYDDMAVIMGSTPAQRSSKRASSSWLTEEEHAELVSELKRVEAAARTRPGSARPLSANSSKRWEERKRQSMRLMPAGAVGPWHKEGPLPALDLAPSPSGLPPMLTPSVDGAPDTPSRGPSPSEPRKDEDERRIEAPSPLPEQSVLARGVPKHAVFVARRSSSLPDAAAVAQALATAPPVSSLEPIKHSSTLAMRITNGGATRVPPKPAAQHAQQHRLSAVLAASNESAQAGAHRSSQQSHDASTSELTAALQAAREKTLLAESEARAQQVTACRLLRRCHAMLELQRRHIAALSAASPTSGASETNDSNQGSADSTSQSQPRRGFSPPSKGTKADDERLALLLTDVRAFTDAASPRRRGGSKGAKPQEPAKDAQAESLLRSESLDGRGEAPPAVETHQSPGTATTKTLAPPPTRPLGELVDESGSRAASVAASAPTHRAIRHIGSFENIPGASPPPQRPVSLVPSTTSAAARYAKSVTGSTLSDSTS